MTHEEYQKEICAAIDELSTLRPTAERVRCMHDYLYIKKHFAEYAEHKHMMHEKSEDGQSKSYFGG